MSTALESLQFVASQPPPGLVATSGPLPSRIEEQYSVRQAKDIGDIDYVFFRRYSDGRSSQVAACVIDNSADRLNEAKLADIHHKLWLNGCAPLLYVGWQTRVDVLSCARGPDFWTGSSISYDPAETIDIAAQISLELEAKIKRFSAYRLSDGTFWEDPSNFPLAESSLAAHRQLTAAVVETDRDIEGEKHPVLRRLLLLIVLIKYLEDREVFPNGWFSQFHRGADSFLDVLRGGSPDSVRDLLSKLERKFNGDVFQLPESEQGLSANELRHFADLVEARTIRRQRYLWSQFSFRYIPVEVLSHIYQHFAQKGEGAVFTPPIVANLMLDYAMPFQHLTQAEKIFDPTCGSGIFLVGAFRRMVQFWRSKHDWKQPDVATLKNILRRGIFGIELQEEAIHLTAFSLALAICDVLQPNVIWKELRFDKLVGTNLLVGDFFEQVRTLQAKFKTDGFTVVVGNPPFRSKLTQAARKYRHQGKSSVAIPDNQMAYFIAEQSAQLLRDGGRLCLIQPHGFLYNDKARAFQRNFIATNQLEAVFDFTSIRNLYDGADPKTIAILATNQKPSPENWIRHLTFRRTFSVKERITLELDHYDRHLVSQETAQQFPWIWRVNLLGGGRLRSIAERMQDMPTLKEFVEARRWDYGEGFIAAASGKRERAPWLTGKPLLPTEAFTEAGIDESKITTVAATRFRSAYTRARYSAPLVMIRAHESLPCVYRKQGFLAYKDKIVGIHAEKRDEAELGLFYETFIANRDMLRAFCLLYGTQALLGKSTAILKRDLDVLPWPTNGKKFQLSWWEKILCDEITDYMGKFVRLGQNSRLLTDRVAPANLRKFSTVFIRLLGTVYSNLRPAESGALDGLAFQAFCFGERSKATWPLDSVAKLREIIYRDHGDTFRTVRILRFYERNTIIIIKPDRLRYWIPSVAIRDADETLVDLREQGY